MRNAPFVAICAAFGALALVACGASQRPAEEPSSTTATTGVSVTTTSGPASPGVPAGILPTSPGVSVSSAAPATPMEGSCPSGGAPVEAEDLASCVRGCRGMDEAVPLGSRCVSARVACEADCRAKF